MAKTAKKKTKRKTRTKAQLTPEKWLESSVRIVDTQGRHGETRRRFNVDAALTEFQSWTYAAIMRNANAIAALPLRLFIRKRSVGLKLFNTRKPRLPQFKYLTGQIQGIQPSRVVAQKLIEFGDDFEEVTDPHPILDLLHTVNPFYNGFDLLQLLVIYLEAVGNAYWHPVIGELGVPDEIWPMPSQWTWVIPDRETYIRGYIYGRSSEVQQEFSPDEVIHFRTANPSDEGIWYGMGKIEAAWKVIMLNTAAHDMDLSFVENRARPDYMVIVKGGATSNELDRFEADVDRQLKGVAKAGRFITLTGDVNVMPLNFAPKDLAGREEIVEEIAAIFGTPVSLLKANDPNLASAKVGFSDWRQNTVLSLAKLIEQKLNERLLPLFGIENDAVLAFDNPVPADREGDLAESQALVSGGIRAINEDREMRGDPPMEGGEILRVNGVSLEKLDAEAPALPSFSLSRESENPPQAVAAVPRPAAVAASLGSDEITKIAEAVAEKLDVPRGTSGDKGDNPVTVTEVTEPTSQQAIWFKAWSHKQEEEPQEDLRDGEIPNFQERMADILDQQARAIIAELSNLTRSGGLAFHGKTMVLNTWKSAHDDVIRRILAQDRWNTLIAEASRPFIQTAVNLGGAVGAEKLSQATSSAIGFDVQNPATQRFVDRWTVRLADQVNQFTGVQLSNLIGEGLDKGESIFQLRTRVQEWASDADPERGAPARAEMIARTESARAYVAGESEAWKQSDVKVRKKWLLAPNACEFCRATAAEFNKGGGIELDEDFYQKGDTVIGADGGRLKLDYSSTPGPPLHPNDRCDLVPVIEDERQAASHESTETKALADSHVCMLVDEGDEFVSFETDGEVNPTTVFGTRADGSTSPTQFRYDRVAWTTIEARLHCQGKGGTFQEAVDIDATIPMPSEGEEQDGS